MKPEKRLILTLLISLAILVAEIIGGMISNSLALLSDAGHVFTDSLALSLSLIASVISRKAPDEKATFGYQRIGLLAAIINGLSLLGISVYIFHESYNRFMSPPEIRSSLMLVVASAGLIGNIVMAYVLSEGHSDLNIKSAWLHIIGDLLASIGVIVAAVIIYFTGFVMADPIASIAVGGLILIGGLRVVKEALGIFLEMVPKGYDLREIRRSILDINGVIDIHDVHLWSISHGKPSFSAHVLTSDLSLSEVDTIRGRIEGLLSEFGIDHTVLQLECGRCENDQNAHL
ncbi:MAG: cation transporter [Nitrospirota bacterium]|nr:MAG: cation transporter [Nitrospirota bacterium]